MEKDSEMSEQNEIQKIDEIVDPIASLANSDMKDGVIIKTRCILCKNPNRSQAEEMFERGDPIPKIKQFLDSKGLVIAPWNIRHHMQEHYKNLEKRTILAEYCDNLAEMRKTSRNRIGEIENNIDIAKIELARVIPIQTNNDINKEKERVNLMMKLMETIRSNVHMLNEMDSIENRVKAHNLNVLKAWKMAIESAKTETEKQAYITSLKNYKELMKMTTSEEEE